MSLKYCVWKCSQNLSRNSTNDVHLLECMAGYTGLNCTIRCPYPSYGVNCQGTCNCSEEDCDVSTGCELTTGTFQMYFLFF